MSLIDSDSWAPGPQMVVPLGKVMGSAVLLDKVYYWSVEFIAPSHFQFTRLLCVCGQRCDLSFPLQPPAAISPQLFQLRNQKPK